jgi:hypothetical protein
MAQDDFAIERTDTALTIRSRSARGWMGYPFMLIGAVCLWGALPTSHGRATDPGLLLVAAALVGIGIAIRLPRDVTTTFDLRAKEVRQTARSWTRVRERVVAFDDVANIGFYQPDMSEPQRLAVIRVKRGEQMQIVASGKAIEERVMGFIAATTGLAKVDTVGP